MPRALQPYDPANAYGLTAAPQVQTVDLRRLMIALRRQRATILLPAVLMGALGVVYAKTAPDTYSGYASMMLDSNMNGAIRQAGGMDPGGLPDNVIENARVVLMSDKLALDVLDRTGLSDNLDVLTPRSSGLSQAIGKAIGVLMRPVGWLRQQVNAVTDTTPPERQGAGAATVLPSPVPVDAETDPRRRAAAAAIQSGVGVFRQGRSTAITISYSAYDPDTAARVANAYADAYVQDMLSANANAVGQTTAWMRGRLDELREQAESAAAAAERFSAENGLIGAADGGLLTSQVVSELNTSLTAAIGDVARAQAVLDTYDEAVAGGVEGLANGYDLTIGGDVSSDLSARISRYNDVRARLARVTANSGPNSSQALGLRQTLRSSAERLFVDLQAQQQEARTALTVAQARVDALRASLDEATQRNNDQAANLVKLESLKKEAETLSQLYQSTLGKAQEIEQQQSFPVSNVRILSYAQPPVAPSGPSTKRAALAMAMLGLFLGMVHAAIREAGERFLRTSSDVTDHSSLRFLGHLPIMARPRPRPLRSVPPTPPEPPREGDGRNLPVLSRRRNPPLGVDIPVLAQSNSVYAETLRHVQLAVSRRTDGQMILGVTSFHPYDNRAAVSLNLAAQMGLSHAPVLVIDADSRGRALSRMVGAEGTAGLSEAATGTDRWQDLLLPVAGTPLSVLSCGQLTGGRSVDLITPELLAGILREAAEEFAVVVVDVPPLYPVAQGRAILGELPQFVVVGEWGRTPRELAELALADDAVLESRCTGVVYDRVNLRRLRRYLPPGTAETYLSARRAFAGPR